MKESRKAARHFLKECNLETYTSITKTAKLTPRQKIILDKYIIEDEPISYISNDLSISENTAERYLCKSYDRIYEEIMRKDGTKYHAGCVTIMEDKK